MASTGGNLLQRTRCFYFYDVATPCNKREPGSGCSAINGINRINAILGTSESCIATHPSDLCVALAALEATVHVAGRAGERAIAFADFHRLPGDTPHIDTNLKPDEIITAIELPAKGFAANYSYLKIRDRLSYAFALVSVAAALELEGGRIKAARLALGGVAPKPWRNTEAEAALQRRGARRRRVRQGRRRAAARRQGLRAQRLQDRAGPPRHGAHLDAGRERHPASPVQQEDPVSAMASYIGTATSRVDGRAKVTGMAQYAGEFKSSDLAYGAVVTSTIAKGRIAKIDASRALAVEGVLDVLTHANRPQMGSTDAAYHDDVAPEGSPFRPLYDDAVKFNGQPIALVIADDWETARFAATLVRVEYQAERHATDLHARLGQAFVIDKPEKPRGDAAKALAAAAVRHEAEYFIPTEHHNPMELFAATAVWNGNNKLTVFDKTQGVQNVQRYVCGVFGLKPDDVRVMSPFVGGAFGSGLRPQYEVVLAVQGALQLKRSVRVVLTREQMYGLGYRPATIERVALGAKADGTLDAITHEAIAITSQYEEFSRNDTAWSELLYKSANAKYEHKLTRLDLPTASDMRAPGAATGVYALECAMDELAIALKLDPVELRLRCYSDRDQHQGVPYTSKQLKRMLPPGRRGVRLG